MADQSIKCVIVVDEALPAGMQANAAAVLGVTLGVRRPDLVGCDVVDASGVTHAGIVTIPIPILKSGGERLRALCGQLRGPEFQDVLAVDFSDVAQRCRAYDEYLDRAARTAEEEHAYVGLAMCGPAASIKRLTGNLPLLR